MLYTMCGNIAKFRGRKIPRTTSFVLYFRGQKLSYFSAKHNLGLLEQNNNANVANLSKYKEDN